MEIRPERDLLKSGTAKDFAWESPILAKAVIYCTVIVMKA